MAFDADTSHLDVVPDAPAYGTKLRWSAPNLIAAANEKVLRANARARHVLVPANEGPRRRVPNTQVRVIPASWHRGRRAFLTAHQA
ncbi:hypothetical protein AB0I49_21405 [Streptomyces sp. NPDC050617]|uniref:hypothetical protein n=1 Tax=Streptomyces sp. NPDC050617 TaxID=3154628 RepID=UPI003421CA87